MHAGNLETLQVHNIRDGVDDQVPDASCLDCVLEGRPWNLLFHEAELAYCNTEN